MSAVFNHAVRHECLDKNPITLVCQSAKRESIPETLTVEEIRALLAELELRDRTLVLIDAGCGFRESRIACPALGRSPGHRTLQNRGVRLARGMTTIRYHAERRMIPIMRSSGSCGEEL
jgi:site-specific recombinase XerC